MDTFTPWALGTILAAAALYVIIRRRKLMATALENAERETSEATTVMQSAGVLLDSLKAKLDEAIASGDMARVQAISDALDTEGNKLAAAVARNTIAEDETPADPDA